MKLILYLRRFILSRSGKIAVILGYRLQRVDNILDLNNHLFPCVFRVQALFQRLIDIPQCPGFLLFFTLAILHAASLKRNGPVVLAHAGGNA